MRLVLLTALLFALSVAPLHAQDCPTGMAGLPNCIPPDYPGSPSGPGGGRGEPGGVWMDGVEALAMGTDGKGFSTSGVMTSARRAKNTALEQCRAKGGVGCRVILPMKNQCGAMVWGETYWATGLGPLLQDAIGIATKMCQAKTTDCQVYYSSCASPQRLR